MEAVARQPEAYSKINSVMVIGFALTESCAIYGFVTGLIMLFTKA
jgi:F-type H+-transporting ATPase subunit c